MHNTLPEKTHTDIIEWAAKTLNQPNINPIIVLERPWSNVLKINTPQGLLYLKQTPPNLFVEVDIIKKCRDLCKITDIPEVIAENSNLHCFLMKECGDVSLRTLFDGHLNVDILVQVLHIYRTMQQATTPHVNIFIQTGAPDWRLEQFPKLYQILIRDKDFLKSHGLDSMQIKILQESLPTCVALCQELASYKIPECLNHSDFHDNNMLFSHATKKVSIIDLGETAIDHPFFSLTACLKNIHSRYQLELESQDYQKLHATCFQGWLTSNNDLQKALIIVQKLLPIYLIFAHIRLVNSTCPVALRDIPRMNDRIKDAFIGFINEIL